MGNVPTMLTGPQQKQLLDALEEVYDPTSLQMMLLYRLDRKLHNYALGDDFIEILFRLIDKLNKHGVIDEFVAAAAAERKGPKLTAFAAELRAAALEPILPSDAVTAGRLEKLVNDRSSFQDVARFLDRLRDLSHWLCRITLDGAGGGTGVLVARDLVLTNYHVVESLIAGEDTSVACVFDYKRLSGGLKVDPGRTVPVAQDWRPIARRYSDEDLKLPGGQPAATELDYALLRLAEPVGEQPPGTTPSAGAAPRSWLELTTLPRVVEAGDPLLILQHPQPDGGRQQPMQLTLGTASASPWPMLRTRYNVNTLPGSSGSPVFDADLHCVALHHAGDPAWAARYNQAVPIAAILADLQTRVNELQAAGLQQFWR
jgi:hypothetical protein